MSDGSSEQPKITAGLDLGDKYSYLCLIDQQSGEVIEEGRLRTTPEAFRRRFASEQRPLRIAIEAGTHSPWASRVLEESGQLVTSASPPAEKAKTIRPQASRATTVPTPKRRSRALRPDSSGSEGMVQMLAARLAVRRRRSVLRALSAELALEAGGWRWR